MNTKQKVVCPRCQYPMKPVIVNDKIDSWFCEKCHLRIYPVPEENSQEEKKGSDKL